jgi:2-amino-4-hydroxy-6-hydroxymethyldihydropteridine diphosphokinase
MKRVYILTGGNIGDTRGYLRLAVEYIQQMVGEVIQQSSLYCTAAWGKVDQADFINQVLVVETSLSAPACMESLLFIEEKMGRKRLEKYGPRIIDLDILLFDQEIHDTSLVQIPHPALPKRRFALTPLAEIAGELMHPITLKTITEMLVLCPDSSPVYKMS